VNALMDDAQKGKGSVAMLLNDPKFRDQLSDTLTQVNGLVAGVSAGKGTLGKLTTDDAAYTNLNKLLTESTNLVTTIRSDPKKYLTIHMKIF
jgi:phospholipid/cholesterol/gamma-HCH transport system substrate-binding protein